MGSYNVYSGGRNSGTSAALAMQKNVPPSGPGSLVSSSYTRTRAALAAVRAGTADMKIGLIGDSTQAGAYALGAGTVWAGNRAVSHTPYFSAALNSADLPTFSSAFFGDQNVTASGSSIAAYDPRVAQGAGWTISVAQSVGKFMCYNVTTTNGLTFLPTNECDTFDIYYLEAASGGEFTVSRTGDATSAAIPTANATFTLKKYTFTGALGGANPVSIQRNGVGAGVFIVGINAYNSTIKSAQVFNLGWNGGGTTDWAVSTFPYSPLPTTTFLACDHYVLTVGINEWGASVNLATFQTNLLAIIDALLVVGDVSLATGYPSAKSATTLAIQKTYIDVIYTVAAARNLIVNDVWRKVGSYEQGNAFAYYANTLHPVQKLYQLKAESDASMILSL